VNILSLIIKFQDDPLPEARSADQIGSEDPIKSLRFKITTQILMMLGVP
jgi:hypothetical protein